MKNFIFLVGLLVFSFSCVDDYLPDIVMTGKGDPTENETVQIPPKSPTYFTSLTSLTSLNLEALFYVYIKSIKRKVLCNKNILDYLSPITFLNNIPIDVTTLPTEHLVSYVEHKIRRVIPYAGNQIQDLLQDPVASAKLSILRKFAEAINCECYGKDLIKDVFPTGIIAYYFEAGLCNEYSALTFTYLTSLGTSKRIQRIWSPTLKHSYVRYDCENSEDAYLVDPWTTSRNSLQYYKTRLSLETSPNINSEFWESTDTAPLTIGVIEYLDRTIKEDIIEFLSNPSFIEECKAEWVEKINLIAPTIVEYQNNGRINNDWIWERASQQATLLDLMEYSP